MPARPGSEDSSSGVVVVDAATVICVRLAPAGASERLLHHADFDLNEEAQAQLRAFEWVFRSGLQVLVGQSEVVNWVRSRGPTDLVMMRYGGEYKFAGGSKDTGETLEQTARRELAEEFDTKVPRDAVLRSFRVNSTRAVQGRSYRMWNFLCLADENPWLSRLDCSAVNSRLAEKRRRFDRLLAGGPAAPFWSMAKAQREAVSPEVREIAWMSVADLVETFLRSKSASLDSVNEFQQREFARHGILRRDPMYASMGVLRAVEDCGSIDGLRKAARNFDKELSERAAEEARTQTWDRGIAKL